MSSVPLVSRPLRQCQVFPTDGQTSFEGSLRWARGITLDATRSVIVTKHTGKPGSCMAGVDVLRFSDGLYKDDVLGISGVCASCEARYTLHMRREQGI